MVTIFTSSLHPASAGVAEWQLEPMWLWVCRRTHHSRQLLEFGALLMFFILQLLIVSLKLL